MLTINTGMAPVFGTKFQPKIQNKNNFIQKSDKLSGMPQTDVFIKSNNVSFGGAKYGAQIGRLESVAYNQNVLNALDDKLMEIMSWAATQPKYEKYFKEIDIKAPSIDLVEGGESSLNKDSEKGEVSSYIWLQNRIIVNKSFLPNLMLISDGKMAIVPQRLASKFLQRSSKDDINAGFKAADRYKDLVDIGDKSIESAIMSSKNSKRENYYYQLSPKEIAEIAAPYLAHEVDHLIMTHIAYNTSPSNATRNYPPGTQAFMQYFDRAKKINPMREAYACDTWNDTYPAKYKQKNGRNMYAASDYIQVGTSGVKKSLRMSRIPKFLNEKISEFISNPLEINAQQTALDYMNSHKPKPNTTAKASVERMNCMYNYQKQALVRNIRSQEAMFQAKFPNVDFIE